MKINGLHPGQIFEDSTAKPRKSTSSIDFRALLESKLHAPQEIDPVAAISSVDGIDSEGGASLRLDGLAVTESALSHLEQYSAALADSKLKGRDLEPYVSALEEETLALLEIRSHFSEDDSLAVLLDRVATVTYLETVKFRRGDYTSA